MFFGVLMGGRKWNNIEDIFYVIMYDECIFLLRLLVMNSIKNRLKFIDLWRVGLKFFVIKMY